MVSVGAPEGTYNPGPRSFNLVVKSLGPAAKPLILKDDGRSHAVEIK